MIDIEQDRFGTKYFAINNKWVGRADHHDFVFILDRDSEKIYSDDTDRYFTPEEISEFMEYLKKDNERRKSVRKELRL